MQAKEIFYDWGGLNQQIFLTINQINFEPYNQLMLLGTWLGFYERIWFYLLAILIFGSAKSFKANFPRRVFKRYLAYAAGLLLAYILGTQITEFLKDWFHYPRPYMTLPGINHFGKIMDDANDYRSLPSGHATFAMIITAISWRFFPPRRRWILIVFALWIGWSRMALGVHYPADVIAGYAVGLAAAIPLIIIDRKLFPA